VNGDVFVAQGCEHIWASSGYSLKWAFCRWFIDVEARVYVHMVSYAPGFCSTKYFWFGVPTT